MRYFILYLYIPNLDSINYITYYYMYTSKLSDFRQIYL